MPTQADSLPPIRLISFDSAPAPQPLPAPPQDLRSLRVEEFLKTRSLSVNSQKAYRREVTRFLKWTDRSLADITPLVNEGLSRTEAAQSYRTRDVREGTTATS